MGHDSRRWRDRGSTDDIRVGADGCCCPFKAHAIGCFDRPIITGGEHLSLYKGGWERLERVNQAARTAFRYPSSYLCHYSQAQSTVRALDGAFAIPRAPA